MALFVCVFIWLIFALFVCVFGNDFVCFRNEFYLFEFLLYLFVFFENYFIILFVCILFSKMSIFV